jgi:hypothetical protein
MPVRAAAPTDLADAVADYLKRKKRRVPAAAVLREVFEVMYVASLRTEESQFVRFHVAFVDPSKPDPRPPKRVRRHRWREVRLAAPQALTVHNAAKIARASDPRTSSLAIFGSAVDRPSIWGLIDQAQESYGFATYESDSGFAPPGLFQASVDGLGHITAHDGFTKIAELNVTSLIANSIDVLHGGPVRAVLDPGIHALIEEVRRTVTPAVFDAQHHWPSSISHDYVRAICRLLSRIRGHRHGGAVLIAPAGSTAHLRVKYEVNYPRLPDALRSYAVSRIGEAEASDEIWDEYLKKDEDFIPATRYLDEAIAISDADDGLREIDGTLWFISLLSRVDGVVLMDPSLRVHGFGVEITCTDAPAKVFRAREKLGRRSKRTEVDYEHFGTRHRSMMRYCHAVPGSVGFVISQDGDVRAFTRVGSELLMWEQLKLEIHTYAPEARRLEARLRAEDAT